MRFWTKFHKKQMKQECIPVGCVPSAAVAVSTSEGGYLVLGGYLVPGGFLPGGYLVLGVPAGGVPGPGRGTCPGGVPVPGGAVYLSGGYLPRYFPPL